MLKKFFHVVEQAPALVVITDANGLIEYVNPKFTQVTGYTSKEVIGKNPRILKSGKQSLEFYKELWTIIKSGKEWRGEFFNKKKNGGYYWESTSISSIKNNKGEITHFIAIKEDITEQKKAEEKLKKLSSVIEQTGDSVFITNKKGIIEYVNPTFESLTGFTSEEVIGKTPRIFKSGKHNKEFYENFWNTIISGKIFCSEFVNRKKNGKLYYEQQTITPLKDLKGNITNFVSTGRDITEQKKAKQEIISLKEHIIKIEKLEKDKRILSEKVTKLTKKIPLTENEKLVFYGLIKYPLLNDEGLAKELMVNRSTITSIKNRLLRQDFYSTYIIPNFELIDCELMCILNGKMPTGNIKGRKNTDIFEKVISSPEVVYNLNTDKEFLIIIISKKFAEAKKLIDTLSVIYDGEGAEKLNVNYFPFTTSKIFNLFDYSDLLKSLFNLKIKNEPKKLIKSAKRKLTNNEKIILYTLTKYPNFTDIEISAKTKISRSTISQIKKNLINENFLKIINIPNDSKLNCELIVYSNTKVNLRKINKENLEILPLIFVINSEREGGNIFVFEDYTKYKTEYDKLMSLLKKERSIRYLFPIQQIRSKKMDFAPLVKKIFELNIDF